MAISGTYTPGGLLPVYTAKVSEDMWFLVPLLDDTDQQTGETGVASGSVDCDYATGGATSFTSYSVTADDWKEVDEGLYWLRIGASEFTAAGNYVVRVGDTTPNAGKFAFVVQVNDVDVNDLVRSTTPANTLSVDSSGRIDTGKWLGTAVTLSSTSAKPEVDVASISDDSAAANTLETQIEGTALLNVNVEQISTSATAADNCESIMLDSTQLNVNVSKISDDSAAADSLESIIEGTSLLGVNVTQISDDSAAASTLEAMIEGTSLLNVNVEQISSDATAADTMELFAEALDQATGQIDAGTFAADAIAAATIATDAIAADGLAADAATEIAAAVWDRAAASHVSSASMGYQLSTNIPAILADTGTDGVKIDVTQVLGESHSARTLGRAWYLGLASLDHRWTTSGGQSVIYKEDNTTAFSTRTITDSGEIGKGS